MLYIYSHNKCNIQVSLSIKLLLEILSEQKIFLFDVNVKQYIASNLKLNIPLQPNCI